MVTDAIIVFGQGPVERGTSSFKTADLTGSLNKYCEINTLAAAVLYEKGETKKIILTGGRTGPDEGMPSESELMRAMLIDRGIPAADIVIEDKSRDTGENFIKVVNMLDSKDGGLDGVRSVALLASHHHLARVVEMAGIYFPANDLDLVQVVGRFSAEETLSYVNPKWAGYIRQNFNPNIDETRETEGSHRQRKMRPENRWLHPVKFQPEAAIPQVLKLKDETRIRLILSQPFFRELLQEYNVDLENDVIDDIRTKLGSVEADFPAEELMDKWPERSTEDPEMTAYLKWRTQEIEAGRKSDDLSAPYRLSKDQITDENEWNEREQEGEAERVVGITDKMSGLIE